MGSSNSKELEPTGKPPRDTKRVAAAREHIEPIHPSFEELGNQIQGQVILAPEEEFALGGNANSDAYHGQRERPFYFNDWNYPSVIILPETVDDVSMVIKMIKELDRDKYHLSIAAGCHSSFGMINKAICLDLCKLKGVSVNMDTKEVTLGGGCKISDVHAKLLELAPGYAFVTGTNPDTGVSGLTLAGGAGYLGMQAGFACDTVTKVKVVLESGEIVTATDTNEHKDLLRAIRGGGGNFGVVVEWTFKLYDVSNAFGGVVVHLAPTMARIKIVMQNYMKTAEDAPDSAGSLFAMPCGAPVFITVLSMIGDDVRDAKKYTDIPYLAKASSLDAWLRPEITLGRKDYITEIAPMLEAVQQRSYAIAIGVMVYSMDDAMLDAIIHFTRVDYPKKNVKPLILFMKFGGEMTRNDGSHSSIRHRNATGWILFEAAWEPHATEEEINTVKDWAKRAKQRVLELGGEDGPHNFADSDGRRIKFFTEEQRSFLKGAKQKYDPSNLFAMNKNIVISHTE